MLSVVGNKYFVLLLAVAHIVFDIAAVGEDSMVYLDSVHQDSRILESQT